MIAHLLRIMWNRKRRNLLLLTELFFSFMVLLFVVGVGLYYADNYRQPLGFAHEGVWSISVAANQSGPGATSAEAPETSRQLLLAARDFPQVTAAAFAFTGPYDWATWSTDYDSSGRHLEFAQNPVTDDFDKALGLELTRGRWFSRQDDGATEEPTVVNERLARMAFGSGDPIGQLLPQDTTPHPGPAEPPRRVIGVIRDFRQNGEFEAPGGYAFLRNGMTDIPRLLIVKVRPGTTVAFEETLTRRLQDVAKDWSFKVQPVRELRASNHRQRLAPLVAIGLIAGFLLLMVALGLTGVLWQNVTERTREIGLRRALGATGGGIRAQVVGEILVLSAFAIILAATLVLQLPFLTGTSVLSVRMLASSLAVSMVVLLTLAALCALHPARLASRMGPAEALHYE